MRSWTLADVMFFLVVQRLVHISYDLIAASGGLNKRLFSNIDNFVGNSTLFYDLRWSRFIMEQKTLASWLFCPLWQFACFECRIECILIKINDSDDLFVSNSA